MWNYKNQSKEKPALGGHKSNMRTKLKKRIIHTVSKLYSFEIVCANLFLYRHNYSYLTREQASAELAKVEVELKNSLKWQTNPAVFAKVNLRAKKAGAIL